MPRSSEMTCQVKLYRLTFNMLTFIFYQFHSNVTLNTRKALVGATSARRAQRHPLTTGHLMSSITWPLDSPYAISCWWSIGTEPLSPTVFEIFGPTYVNERTNKHKQTRRIAIPPDGGKNDKTVNFNAVLNKTYANACKLQRIEHQPGDPSFAVAAAATPRLNGDWCGEAGMLAE